VNGKASVGDEEVEGQGVVVAHQTQGRREGGRGGWKDQKRQEGRERGKVGGRKEKEKKGT